MANMSYCRFRNTEGDLDDCLEALDYNEELSDEEFKACKRMINNFLDFCERRALIEVDYDRVEEFFETEIYKEEDEYEDEC